MVNKTAQDNVQKSLDGVTSDKSTGVAGIVFVAVDKNGDEICANASGSKGLSDRGPMDLDTVFWIASCTKLLATMACMQAVEQGKLRLDDSKQVYELCPELQKVQVLKDDGTLVDKENDITLRMLLSHTAGFGYELYVLPGGFSLIPGRCSHVQMLNAFPASTPNSATSADP